MTISLLGVSLVVGSSIAYSALDLLRKVLVVRIRAVPLLFYLSVGQVPFFLAWLLREGEVSVAPGYYLPGLASVVLNIFANLAFMEAVRLSPLSMTVPFLSLAPVFTSILGIAVLGEIPTAVQWIGVAVVVVGALRLNLEGGETTARTSLWNALVREKGSVLMVLVALLWSLAMPLDKVALGNSSPAFHGAVLNAGVGAGMFVALAMRRQLSDLRTVSRGWLLVLIAVLVSVAGLAFLLVALGYLWVAVAETLRRAIGSLLALILGRLAFGERLTRAKVLAVTMMAIGVALILL
jgi:drug/metabolite transporter (DMT)-like permease